MRDVELSRDDTQRALQAFVDALQEFVLLAAALQHGRVDRDEALVREAERAAGRAIDAGRSLRDHLLDLCSGAVRRGR